MDGGEREIIEGMKQILQGSALKSVMIEITEVSKDDDQVKEIINVFKNAGFKEALRIDHSGFKNYPLVADVLFTKNWELTHG